MPPKRKLSGSFTRKQTRRSRRSTSADSESTPPNDQLPIEPEPTSAPNTPPNVTGDILAANALSHNDIEDASFVAALQQPADNAVQTPSQTELQATLLEDRRLANSISRKAGQAGRITWTLHMTEVLVDATLTHVRNNTRAYSNGFGDITWDDIAKRIQTECGPAAGGVNAEKARDKIDNMRKKFNIWESLRHRPGWVADPETGLLEVADSVWVAGIAVNPAARTLRKQPLQFCWQLLEIYTGQSAPDRYALDFMDGLAVRPAHTGQMPGPSTTAQRLPAQVLPAQYTPTPVQRPSGTEHTVGRRAQMVDVSMDIHSRVAEVDQKPVLENISEVKKATRLAQRRYKGHPEWPVARLVRVFNFFRETVNAEVYNELDEELGTAWLSVNVGAYK